MNPQDVIARLAELRALDAPTHGGRLLSYVYDSGRPELDELAAAAVRTMQPVNGLDPTTFRSVAVIERELVDFARSVFHADDEVVGTATSGGTESCILAVKTARDAWRARHRSGTPRLVAPTTVHAAFRKAAALLDVALDLVPVDPSTGRPDASAVIERLGDDVALVVVSAPSYPYATLDPVVEVAAAALAAGVDLHVDACIGGFALAFWPQHAAGAPAHPWDFAVPGVTSLSADLHKYGYAPKGVSVLLQRGRDRQRHQWFATSAWPGYPVVNATLLGSKSAAPLAAAWAITSVLGVEGFRELTDSMAASTGRIVEAIDAIEGLSVVGRPTGPMVAVAVDASVPADRRVDPHLWADAMRDYGFVVQLQPASIQPDGSWLPSTAHLTITPVTEQVVDELVPAAAAAADAVRGMPHLDGAALAQGLLGGFEPDDLRHLNSDAAVEILRAAGLLEPSGLGALAPVLALVEALPSELVERLLIELLAVGLER
ncbi:pyridoxal phosphate-dependent decarboxylase family protein [Microbacterium sp. ASV49]|uniref:Aminotransferase class V-fold PLP-dependent enzyme n=1 Tax=Microbacterium candidum TaxID=3041922 RepID=A0ABT7MY78_9MICO|nr:aminotransferase class V-fold PLP-dependent enzyme [Microbacterium sp. ASV49]MDL9979402.1 aminotransferase class V-fold PLP-dependent enzyme [Microbacterium sp. ASV49]